MTTGDVETLVMVTVCCGLVFPTATLPKSKAVGEIRNRRMPLPAKVRLKL
jgi:hypothetical protein